MKGSLAVIVEGLLSLDGETVRSANTLAEALAGDSDDSGEAVQECQ